MAKCLPGIKKCVQNLTEFPLLYAISIQVLHISRTQQPLGRYFHSDEHCNAPQNTFFFLEGAHTVLQFYSMICPSLPGILVAHRYNLNTISQVNKQLP